MLGYLVQARDELSRASQANKLSQTRTVLAKAGADLAKFHLGEIKADYAQRTIQQAISLEPNFPPAAVASGLIAEQKADFAGARKSYEAALQRWPGMLLAQRQLAILLAEKLSDDAAALQLATALRQDFPDDPALGRVLGMIAYRRADYREAVRLLASAASRQPNDGDLLYHLGMAQYRINDQSAKASLSKAISLDPNAAFVVNAKKTLAELN
jgi:Flp pilus assembly protein TadD